MARILNRHVTHGVGGSGVSVDNVLVIPGGGTPAWQSTSNIVCNAPPFGSVSQFDPNMRLITPWHVPGCDVIRAGGGNVAASANGERMWLRNDAGFWPVDNQQALDVDREFGIAIAYTKQEGKNIVVYFPDWREGQQRPIIATEALDKSGARCLAGIVAWSELVGHTWTARGYNLATNTRLQVQTLPGDAYQPLLFHWKGELYVLYSDQQGAGHLHPFDAPNTAHTFPANAFGLDAEVQKNASAFIAYCTNAGESAGSLVTHHLTL